MDQDRSRFTVANVVAAFLLMLLLSAMTVQIVLRFGFGTTITWLEELIRINFVWAVYACVLVAAVDDKHIRVALHVTLMPKRWQALVLGIADLGWVVFNAVVIYGAAVYSLSLLEFPYRMPTTGINLFWPFLIIPLAFGLLSIRVLINIRRRARGELEMTDVQKEM